MRKAIRYLAAIAAMLAASCATAAPTPTDESLSVGYVREHISDFHGKTIRMRGELNICTSLSCKICDGPRETDPCLGLTFYADTHSASYLIEELYRFATVTVETTIDSTCVIPRNAEGVVVLCTDRATSAREARVVTVHARKPGSLGRWDSYEGEPLTDATPDERRLVRSLMIDMEMDALDSETAHRLYRDPDPLVEGSEDNFFLCTCTDNSCEGRWPTMSGHAIYRTPANPYFCHHVSRLNGAWLFEY